MPIEKPPSVACDPLKSSKWDELTAGRSFKPSDAPALATLCQWYKVMALASDELEGFGNQTAYTTDMGDIKAFPQIQTMKAASSEIRALSKQLGLAGGEGEVADVGHGNVLSIVAGSRKERRARAAG